MSNNIINEGREALERALLVMNYSLEKTLSENKKTLSEQTAMTDQEIEDRRIGNLISNASYGMGTNENQLIKAFGQIKDLAQYNRIENNYKKYNQEKGGGYYQSLSHLLQGEMGEDDLETVNTIKGILAKIGVDLTFGKSIDDSTNEVIIIPSSIKLTPKIANKTGYFTGVFSCIGKTSANQTEGTYQGQKVIRDTQPSSMTVYWEDGHWTRYAYNDKTKKTGGEVARGKFKCNGTKQTMTTDTKKQEIKKQEIKKQPLKKDKQVVNQFQTKDEIKLTADQGL